MSLHKKPHDDYYVPEFVADDESVKEDSHEDDVTHKRHVRKLLEEKLERKRLKDEFDELDGDFDWDEFEK